MEYSKYTGPSISSFTLNLTEHFSPSMFVPLHFRMVAQSTYTFLTFRESTKVTIPRTKNKIPSMVSNIAKCLGVFIIWYCFQNKVDMKELLSYSGWCIYCLFASCSLGGAIKSIRSIKQLFFLFFFIINFKSVAYFENGIKNLGLAFRSFTAVEDQQLYLIMIGSHFFPRNCNTRRACVLRDRRSSLGIHSLAVSKENSRQLRSLQKSQTISLNQLPQKRKSINLKLEASKRQSNILKRQQQHEYQKQPKLNPRKKTLYVKGFCKKPFEIKINNSDEILPRQAITSNGRRIRKDLSEKNRRLDTSIPLHPNFKEVKLIKRKSKDTCVFRGWEINYDDFTDF